MAEKFVTNLHVDKSIVSLLSKSTYLKSFASSVRELVSNAYDADALSVQIRVANNYQKIEIEDDGNGMSRQEFEKYLTIAGTKSTTNLTRKYKRKRIGQFGVGFLSIFPFCEELEITTTVENSDEILIAKIPTIDYTAKSKKDEFVEDVPISGSIIKDKTQRLKHYTIIKLIKPTYPVKQYFSKVETKKRDSIIAMGPMDKFKWELQEDLPISINPDSESKSNSFIKYIEPVGINVFFNDKPLYRNKLPEIILDSGTETIAGIQCSYIFCTDYKSIKPLEARGIKRRVNNVGVGPRTDFDLKRDRGFSRLHWISGEISFSEKIKEHLTLSRDTFVASSAIDEINDYFASKLRQLAYLVEKIAVAEKEIQQSITDTKKGNITPKEEILKSNIAVLKEKGFQIVRDKENVTSRKQNTVHIDKANKIVTITEGDELVKDYIKILNQKFQIVYKNNFSNSEPPCRLSGQNLIEINQNYPLFRSKSYGNLFRRLHIMLLLSEKETKSSKEMYHLIIKNIIKEFEQFK